MSREDEKGNDYSTKSRSFFGISIAMGGKDSENKIEADMGKIILGSLLILGLVFIIIWFNEPQLFTTAWEAFWK